MSNTIVTTTRQRLLKTQSPGVVLSSSSLMFFCPCRSTHLRKLNSNQKQFCTTSGQVLQIKLVIIDFTYSFIFHLFCCRLTAILCARLLCRQDKLEFLLSKLLHIVIYYNSFLCVYLICLTIIFLSQNIDSRLFRFGLTEQIRILTV